MKLQRFAVSALFFCFSTGCAPPDLPGEEAGIGVTREDSGQQLPVKQAADLEPTAQLWPESSGRRYAVFTQSLQDPSRFIVYGVEVPAVPAHDLVFIVEGAVDDELEHFRERVLQQGAIPVLFPKAPPSAAKDLVTLYMAGGQVGSPPPTDPPGVMASWIAQQTDAAEVQR
jgi:hypothetical protein